MKVLFVLLGLFCLASAFVSLESLPVKPSNPYAPHVHKLRNLKKAFDFVKVKGPEALYTASQPAFSQKRQVDQACLNEILDLVAVVNSTSCKELESLFENIDSLSENEVVTILTNQCSGGCITDLQTALISIRGACPAEIFDNEDDVKNALAVLNLPCLKEGNTFCFAKFVNLVTFEEQQNSTDDLPTKAQLDTLCHPCIKRVLSYLSQFSTDDDLDFTFIDLVCLKDRSEYCFISLPTKFKKVENLEEGSTEQINAFLDILCEDRCFAKIVAISKSFAKDVLGEDDFFTNFNGLCFKSEGQYCLSKAVTAGQNADDIATVCSDPFSCGSSCKSTVEKFIGSLGCCLDIFVELVKADNETDQQQVNFFLQFFQNVCEVDLPDLCPFPAIVTVTFTIKNLNWNFVQNNRQLVERYIKLDLAANTGVKFENIEIRSLSALGDDVVVDVVLKPEIFAKEVSDEVKNESDNFQFSSLSQLPASAKNDPLSPYGVQDVETKVEETQNDKDDDSASSILSASVFMFIAGIYLSMF